jgi:hypothetical protein
MSQHDPKIRMRHMFDNAREAVALLGEKSVEELEADRVLQLALTRLVEVVGRSRGHHLKLSALQRGLAKMIVLRPNAEEPTPCVSRLTLLTAT